MAAGPAPGRTDLRIGTLWQPIAPEPCCLLPVAAGSLRRATSSYHKLPLLPPQQQRQRRAERPLALALARGPLLPTRQGLSRRCCGRRVPHSPPSCCWAPVLLRLGSPGPTAPSACLPGCSKVLPAAGAALALRALGCWLVPSALLPTRGSVPRRLPGHASSPRCLYHLGLLSPSLQEKTWWTCPCTPAC